MNYEKIYDEGYYKEYGGSKLSYFDNHIIRGTFRILANTLGSRYQFKSHLDVGCAAGFLVNEMSKIGKYSIGVDLPYIIGAAANKNLYPMDITKTAMKFNLPQASFDMVTFIEVIEHIHEQDEQYVLDNVTGVARKYLLFSSNEDDDNEPTHINLRSNTYWQREIVKRGFMHVNTFSFPLIPWMMLFIRN